VPRIISEKEFPYVIHGRRRVDEGTVFVYIFL